MFPSLKDQFGPEPSVVSMVAPSLAKPNIKSKAVRRQQPAGKYLKSHWLKSTCEQAGTKINSV